jgi:hypothetical protein
MKNKIVATEMGSTWSKSLYQSSLNEINKKRTHKTTTSDIRCDSSEPILDSPGTNGPASPNPKNSSWLIRDLVNQNYSKHYGFLQTHMGRKNKSIGIFNHYDLSAKKRLDNRNISQPKRVNYNSSGSKLIAETARLIFDDGRQIEHSDNYDHHREKSPELRRLGYRMTKGKKPTISCQSSLTRHKIYSNMTSQNVLDTENDHAGCKDSPVLNSDKMLALKPVSIEMQNMDLSERPSIIEVPANRAPHINIVYSTKPSKSIFKTVQGETWKTIDDGKFYIERRLNELAPMCKNQYLKTRMAKSLDMLEEVKKSTSPHSSFHSAFKYIVDQDITKRTSSIANTKHSVLSAIKLKDLELRTDHLPMNAIQDSLELRLKTLEKQERSMARLVTNYKKRHDKPAGFFSIPGVDTSKYKDDISNNINHVSGFPN